MKINMQNKIDMTFNLTYGDYPPMDIRRWLTGKRRKIKVMHDYPLFLCFNSLLFRPHFSRIKMRK